MEEVFESAPNGRLVKYDINTGECSVVLDELFFANGIAVSPDETYILVNETMRYRVKRVYVRVDRGGVTSRCSSTTFRGSPTVSRPARTGSFGWRFFAPRNDALWT